VQPLFLDRACHREVKEVPVVDLARVGPYVVLCVSQTANDAKADQARFLLGFAQDRRLGLLAGLAGSGWDL